MQFIHYISIAIFTIIFSNSVFAAAPTKPAHQVVDIENKANFEDAEFSLKINDIVMPYSVFSVFVMPKEQVEFEVLFAQSKNAYTLINTQGNLSLQTPTAGNGKHPKSPV
ncbi:hypothetical protein P4S63_06020 [Pseudoalteromonas sp. B193]